MTKGLAFFSLFIIPLLVLAQTSGPFSQTLIAFTSVSTFTTFGPNRQLSTGVTTVVITSTAGPQASGNGTSSGVSASSNSTSSPTSTIPLPTAPTTIAAGGGPNGAPLPGASGVNGQDGPGDNYIAAARSLSRNTLIIGIGGLLIGGALTIL